MLKENAKLLGESALVTKIISLRSNKKDIR